MNVNIDSVNHIYNFFGVLIGKQNCMLLDKPTETQNQEKTLKAMQKKLEQNGKPCFLALITEADNRFLKNIERQARREAREAEDPKSQGVRSQAQLDLIGN